MPHSLLTLRRRSIAPASISGLILDLDPSRESSADGAAVTSATDWSGHGNTATQATPAKKPTHKVNILNGQPIFRFDGGDGLVIGTFDLSGTNAVTIFAVASESVGGDQMWCELSAAFSSNVGSFIFYRQGTGGKMKSTLKGATGSPPFISGRPLDTRAEVVSCVLDMSQSAPTPLFATIPESLGYVGSLQAGGSNSYVLTDNSSGNFGSYPLYIGARNQSNTFLTGDIGRMLIYNRALSHRERAQVDRYLMDRFGLHHSTGHVVFDGDSMTAGTGTTSPYPDQCGVLLGSGWGYGNYAANGTVINPDMIIRGATRIDPAVSVNNGKHILVIWGGTNDLHFSATAAATYTALQTYCNARRAAGWKVVVLTMLPRSDAGNPVDIETRRTDYNTSIRAGWSAFADVLYDPASDARIGDLGDETDLTYYTSDHVHLNATGLGIIAAGVATAIGTL